ncbi:MAG: hypothetical protein ACR2FK_08445 [Sphingomicrobium sp.]
MKRILSPSELPVLEASLAAALRRAFSAPAPGHIDEFDELLAKLH